MTTTPLRSAALPSPRGRFTRSVDRALSRALGLPPATTDYTVTRDIPIPMRDGVELLADHYAPATTSPAGTLLIRGPYGRSGLRSILSARPYAQRGYHVVFQSARGTFGSGDVFTPGMHEVDDGADTVAWLRRQNWFTGRFATMGSSYLGFTQWALLVDPPPELAAAVITVGPHDLSEAAWGSGAFSLSDLLGWCDSVAHQEGGAGLKPLLMALTGNRRVRPALNALPLGAAGRKLLGEGAPWYESWVEHHDLTAEFWRPTQLRAALDRVRVPVLLISGWQDMFLGQTLEQYRRLRGRGADVGLTIGPWTHMQLGNRGAPIVARETLAWFDRHLSDRSTRHRGKPVRGKPVRGKPVRGKPVRIFVTGGGGWRDLPDWPPASEPTTLYLQPGAALGEAAPPAGAAPSRFTYDPADPTPTVGGRLLSPVGGYRTDNRLAARADVLTFTGPALSDDLEVVGTPAVELAHQSDNPHADVFVRLSEVDHRGRSRNVSDGFIRLGPNPGSPLRMTLDAVAHRFRAGSRIRLLVAGGSHPRFARNLGTGEPPATGDRLRRCSHVIAHGEGGTSKLVLPVVGALIAP